MITLLSILLAVALAALLLLVIQRPAPRVGGIFSLANLGVSTHENAKTYFADAAFASRFLLAKIGSDAEHIAINTDGDVPIGVVTDEVATADIAKIPMAVELLGISNRTLTMVASEAIDAGEDVYTEDGGKVQDLPTDAGTYYKVGKALTAAGADGDLIEVLHCHPVALVVT
jgi:hypothetical protein